MLALSAGACATVGKPGRDSVYRAASLSQADPVALGESFRQQLRQNNLPQVEMYLFPDRLPPGVPQQANAYYPVKGQGKYFAVGLLQGQEGLKYLRAMVSRSAASPLLTALCRCDSSPAGLEKTLYEFRVFTDVHEMSHTVAQALGLNPAKPDGSTPGCNSPADDLACNISERIADASATLYTMSNFPGSSEYPKVVRDMRAMIMEPTHYTASSIDLAMTQFRARPRQGLSIMETVMWAKRIVDAQRGLSEECDYAAVGYRNVYAQSVVVLPPPVANVLKQAARSRAALFAPRPASKPGHDFTISQR